MILRPCLVSSLLVITVAACQPESESVVGPQDIEEVARPPLSSLPPSDGADPAVISYTVGETRVDSFTFDAPDASEINGNPWGVWFGTNEIVDDPPTPTGNDYWSMGWSHANDWKSNSYSRLYFIPPVRRFSFTHATGLNQGLWWDDPPPDAFGYYVLDTAFHYVIQDSIRANGCPGLCVGATAQGNFTTRIDVSTGDEDRIHHVLFKGYMNIDDLVIVREGQPALECETVTRGSPGKCTLDSAVADTVLGWSFNTVLNFGPFTAESSANSLEWAGVVVDSGTVSVVYRKDSITDTATAVLNVDSREGDDWLWDIAYWDLNEDIAPNCIWDPWVIPPDTLGRNHPQLGCTYSHVIDPPILEDALGGVDDSVVVGGPNDGLWYVTGAKQRMDRATELTPFLRATSTELVVSTHPSDNTNACQSFLGIQKKDPVIIATFNYNKECRGNDLSPMLMAALRHEGLGSGGSSHGHESWRRELAQRPENDAHRLVEALVADSESNLEIVIRGTLGLAEQRLISEGAAHPPNSPVGGNWPSSDIWTIDTTSNRFSRVATGNF